MPVALPYSRRTYDGDGTNTNFSVPYPYINREHIKVYIDWVNESTFARELVHITDFTWVNPTTISTIVPPAIGETITVARETPIDAQLVEWEAGTPPTEFDLDTADRQNLYAIQEIIDGKQFEADEPKIFYVRSDGSDSATGTSPSAAFRHIEYALDAVRDKNGEPWTIMLLDSLSTTGELEVPDFCTVMGRNYQRRTLITPVPGSEESNVFLVGNGCHLVNMKFAGWRLDSLSNPEKGFAMAFRPAATILPGGVPYGQNCVVASLPGEIPTPLPMGASTGNPAYPRGGGCVLADADVLSAYTVYPNIMTWGFTPSSVNGIGYLAKNRGFINPVNAIGVGAHKHFVCLSGGQMVCSGSSSQFGDYSFWSEGWVWSIKPVSTPRTSLTTMTSARTAISAVKATVVTDVWNHLLANYDAGFWPGYFEPLTKKDTGLLLDALGSALEFGFERPMLNFVEGLFRYGGTCVYFYPYHAAFKASWLRVRSTLPATAGLTAGATTAMQALIDSLVSTMDNYWFEMGQGPAPAVVTTVRRKLRSLITAINHQWTSPASGVEFFRVPPSRGMRNIRRSIVQRGGGRVRFSGQDDLGNAVFVGGLQIDSRSGQLGGPPFESAIRSRVTRAVISRRY